MTSPTSVAVFGSTGLTGSYILSAILAAESSWSPVHTISRRQPKASSPALHAVIEPDTARWAPALSGTSPTPSVVITAVGTTRAAAGGIQEQWKIDHDLNIEIAKAAKEAGVKTFVFVSSAGTRSFLGARSPYGKMKNGVEDAVKDLDFETGIIVKPGTILGAREDSRTGEAVWQRLLRGLGSVAESVKDKLGQEVDIIARATIKATQLAAEGKAPSKYWVIDSDEILKLGKKEGE